ncbi:MAG: hypothetical protein A2Y86_05195 [Candidatus Aminicenantes bacterium RBG_13_62_12]|nr:MAG: hypothetical protein A2Y86_05195 [Candidatus Aminicenantes bacterium RBG_13_62_12]
MSEPSKKEMLEIFDQMVNDCISSGGDYGEFPMNCEDEKIFREHMAPIRCLIVEQGKLEKVIEADHQAIMAGEKLALEFLKLQRRMEELKKLADKILMATGKCDDCPLLKDIRDFGKDGRKDDGLYQSLASETRDFNLGKERK